MLGLSDLALQATAFVARTVTAVVRVLPRRPAINDHVFTLLFAHLNDLATTMGSVGGVPVLDMHLLAWLIATVRSTPGGARLAYVKHAAWTTFDELLLSFTGTNINNMSATSAWRRREEVRDGLYDWLDKHPSVLPTLSDADNRRFAREWKAIRKYKGQSGIADNTILRNLKELTSVWASAHGIPVVTFILSLLQDGLADRLFNADGATVLPGFYACAAIRLSRYSGKHIKEWLLEAMSSGFVAPDLANRRSILNIINFGVPAVASATTVLAHAVNLSSADANAFRRGLQVFRPLRIMIWARLRNQGLYLRPYHAFEQSLSTALDDDKRQQTSAARAQDVWTENEIRSLIGNSVLYAQSKGLNVLMTSQVLQLHRSRPQVSLDGDDLDPDDQFEPCFRTEKSVNGMLKTRLYFVAFQLVTLDTPFSLLLKPALVQQLVDIGLNEDMGTDAFLRRLRTLQLEAGATGIDTPAARSKGASISAVKRRKNQLALKALTKKGSKATKAKVPSSSSLKTAKPKKGSTAAKQRTRAGNDEHKSLVQHESADEDDSQGSDSSSSSSSAASSSSSSSGGGAREPAAKRRRVDAGPKVPFLRPVVGPAGRDGKHEMALQALRERRSGGHIKAPSFLGADSEEEQE